MNLLACPNTRQWLRKSSLLIHCNALLKCGAHLSRRSLSFSHFLHPELTFRNVWTKLLPLDVKDRYTALLGIPEAHPLDAGVYTCQVGGMNGSGRKESETCSSSSSSTSSCQTKVVKHLLNTSTIRTYFSHNKTNTTFFSSPTIHHMMCLAGSVCAPSLPPNNNHKPTKLSSGAIKIKQITDGGAGEAAAHKECQSVVVRILPAPSLKIIPPSQTLHKGDSLMIRCLTTNSNTNIMGFRREAEAGDEDQPTPAAATALPKRLGYIWTKNDKLLQSQPGHEYWEDLYPDGSLLILKNIRKSASYKCVVSNTVAPISQQVYINVISGAINQTNVCQPEIEQQIEWPTSAPGPKVLVDCNPRFGDGLVERVCEQQDFESARWLPPDFSRCIPKELTFMRSKFVQMTHGYQDTNATYVLALMLQYVRGGGHGLMAGQVSGGSNEDEEKQCLTRD